MDTQHGGDDITQAVQSTQAQERPGSLLHTQANEQTQEQNVPLEEEEEQTSGSEEDVASKSEASDDDNVTAEQENSASIPGQNDEGDIGDSLKRKAESPPVDEREQKKQRKKSNLSDYDEEDDTTQPRSSSPPRKRAEKKKSLFENILQSHRPRSKQKSEELTEAALNSAAELVRNMEIAAEKDVESYMNGELALAKLAMLEKVTGKCYKPIFQGPLIQSKVLEVLAKWLKPMNKGALPDINVRSEVLKILSVLPVKGDPMANEETQVIDIEHLKQGGIGRAVRILASHPNETPENAKIANAIIDKWSRLVYQKSDNYKAIGSSELPRPKLQRNQKEQEQEAFQRPSQRARIPRPDNYDFTIKPDSKVKLDSTGSNKDNNPLARRIIKKVADLRRKK